MWKAWAAWVGGGGGGMRKRVGEVKGEQHNLKPEGIIECFFCIPHHRQNKITLAKPLSECEMRGQGGYIYQRENGGKKRVFQW